MRIGYACRPMQDLLVSSKTTADELTGWTFELTGLETRKWVAAGK